MVIVVGMVWWEEIISKMGITWKVKMVDIVCMKELAGIVGKERKLNRWEIISIS